MTEPYPDIILLNLTEDGLLQQARLALERTDCIALGGPDDPRHFWSIRSQLFLVTSSIVVFLMQAGFASLEAGSMGSTAVTSTLFKNIIDGLVSGLAYWTVGYGFAYGTGSGSFIGSQGFMLHGVGPCEYAFALFQYTFSSVACTIVSGAIAGRTQLVAYIVISAAMSGFIWPVVAHWTWSDNAWLRDGHDGIGYTDFAGSGIVHVCGSVTAFIMAYMVGPRGTPIFEKSIDKRSLPAHSIPLVAQGTLILWFGFLAFNAGTVATHHLDSMEAVTSVGRAVINTMLCPCGAGVGTLLAHHSVHVFRARREVPKRGRKWSLSILCNGILCGMVSICASVNAVKPWAAMIIGFVAGGVFITFRSLIRGLGVDDPVNAVAVHFGGGCWGVIAVAVFSTERSILYSPSDEGWRQLGWNLLGLVVIICWTATTSGVLVLTLWATGRLRVDDAKINMGLDLCEHGEGAYHISQRAALPGGLSGTLESASTSSMASLASGSSELHRPSIEGTLRRRGGGGAGGGSAPSPDGSHFTDNRSPQPLLRADHGGSGDGGGGSGSGAGDGTGDGMKDAVAPTALQTFNPPATSPTGGFPERPHFIVVMTAATDAVSMATATAVAEATEAGDPLLISHSTV